MSQPFARISLKSVSLLSMGALGGLLVGTQFVPTNAVPSQPSQAPAASGPIAQAPAAPVSGTDETFISAVADKTGPAVVRIDSSRTVRRSPQSNERMVRGTGSGFIVKADGLVLTNAHVVDGATSVTVTLKDGREFTGKVLGKDELTDVAVVKIQGTNLPTAPIGNSEQIKPGEWAIAIGNPLGLDNTVTAGIISGTGRSSGVVGAPDKRVSFIQTDAAINPGNSGGPLLNRQGQVIGMNTAIIGGAQGLGFAIPINQAQRVANQLIATGKVDHPYIGVQMTNLTTATKDALNQDADLGVNVKANQGVVVVGIARRSPAASAGLKAGDVIQAVNGRSVKTADDVQQVIEASKIGANLPIQIDRGGRSLTLTVNPGAFPS
ncbi:MAG: trypsin-like peptidase domain-containing protein [Stenomitos rutilans HA7619-LM2]|jgi:S1-C subfamily serine protease|nr:trypsin-like peptidase domain-containing protein [Stenomitos rutilans HA7619-LM2]